MPKTKKRRPNGQRTPKPRGKSKVFLPGLEPCYRMNPEFRKLWQGHEPLSRSFS